LLQKGLKTCNVLKVAHHGSNHSSTTNFLKAVKPEIAIISLGLNNRYGHPGEDTMRRLERTGAQIYRTDIQGTIKLISDGEKITVSTEKPTLAVKSSEVADVVDSSDYTNKEIPVENASDDQTEKFDLNTATSSQLQTIPGIGPSKATAILSNREESGSFSSINDVQRVSGIGVKTAEKIALHAFVTQ
jgi:comEA protein